MLHLWCAWRCCAYLAGLGAPLLCAARGEGEATPQEEAEGSSVTVTVTVRVTVTVTVTVALTAAGCTWPGAYGGCREERERGSEEEGGTEDEDESRFEDEGWASVVAPRSVARTPAREYPILLAGDCTMTALQYSTTTVHACCPMPLAVLFSCALCLLGENTTLWNDVSGCQCYMCSCESDIFCVFSVVVFLLRPLELESQGRQRSAQVRVTDSSAALPAALPAHGGLSRAITGRMYCIMLLECLNHVLCCSDPSFWCACIWCYLGAS